MIAQGKEQLDQLLEHRSPHSVTIHMPTQRVGRDARHDPLTLENHLAAARDMLCETGMAEGHANEQLAEGTALLDDMTFWRHQGDGLALFIDPRRTHIYRLPFPVPQLVQVSDRFQTKPLLQLLSADRQFYILALSQHESRLFQATRFGMQPMELIDAPQSIDDLLKFIDEEKSLQFHTGGSGRATEGRRSIIFHGHGVGVDDKAQDKRLREYCQMVSRSLRRTLGEHGPPLVFAADRRLQPLFREVNGYHGLVETPVLGNPEHVELTRLHQQAWDAVREQIHAPLRRAEQRFEEASGHGQALHDLPDVVIAAHDARIETLLVASDQQQWGRYDPNAREIDYHPEPRPGDDDLLDLAAEQVYRHGGTVHPLAKTAIPDQRPLAAVLRFTHAA